MRMILAALTVSVAAFSTTPVHAFNFLASGYNAPWCALYIYDGGRDCGYYTLKACEETISGIGGLCQPNLFYRPPPPRYPAKRHHKRRHRSSN